MPTDKKIAKATTSIFCSKDGFPTGAAYIWVFVANRAWDEATATWLEAKAGIPWDKPGGDMPMPLDKFFEFTVQPDETGKWHNIDVTSVTKQFIEKPETNFGIFVIAVASQDLIIYESSESDDISKRPKLEIVFEDSGIIKPFSGQKHGSNYTIRSVNGSLEITTPDNEYKSVELISLNGAKTLRYSFSSSIIKLGTGQVTPGVYIVSVLSKRDTFRGRVVIK